ncbi:hypothetical protein CPS_1493 [Colwellia psychrerythraea 34H]|uniref:Uncharacterized protein n=1 Tax=Colwellia psychrerythraea (strain 34H / ATCC BAA-681) TaxID=167879 RepID=Q485N0_COLP3|nr:hypothetical protein CPS_1493 [Colwellia psychrerythraea 34H]
MPPISLDDSQDPTFNFQQCHLKIPPKSGFKIFSLPLTSILEPKLRGISLLALSGLAIDIIKSSVAAK